jgi:hypothetical protein
MLSPKNSGKLIKRELIDLINMSQSKSVPRLSVPKLRKV